MIRTLKWPEIILGTLLGILVLAVPGLYVKARMEVPKTYAMPNDVLKVSPATGSASRGEQPATVMCRACHGDDLRDNPTFLDGPVLGGSSPPNLATGKGGLCGESTEADSVRVLHRGYQAQRTVGFLMPAKGYFYMSDQDLRDVLACVRALPPVDRGTLDPCLRFTFLGNTMFGAGLFGNMIGASIVDQITDPPAAPKPDVTAEYEAHLVRINSCRDCDSQQLAGGKSPEPEAPPAPHLTDGSELRAGTGAQFITALETGVTPTGVQWRTRLTPWEYTGQMRIEDVGAIWASLKSLPALPTSTDPIARQASWPIH